MKTDQAENEFSDDEKTQPNQIANAILQHVRDADDGVPGPLPEEVTQPIKFGADLGEPPALPSEDDDEKTLVPTGDE